MIYIVQKTSEYQYQFGPVEPSTSYTVQISACNKNYLCTRLSHGIVIRTMTCLELFENDLNHCG